MTFPDFARSIGLIPPPVIELGRTYRVPTITHERKRNGMIRLDADGNSGIACNYENGDGVAQWRSNGEKIEIDHAKANSELTARLARKREREKRGTEKAKAEYEAAADLVGAMHPYLERKRITMDACRKVKIDGRGNLLVPMFQRRNFCSLQRIAPDGAKKFVTGAPTKGASLEIWRPRYSMTILCEGFATGATLFSASQIARVIICFSADNLVTVAERGEWSGLVAVAGDHDWDSICQRHLQEGEFDVFDPDFPRPEWCRCNPGKTAAIKAAKSIGCGVAMPPRNDWNDCFVERLEEMEKSANRFTSPHKLRASALAPIGTAIMRASKMVSEK